MGTQWTELYPDLAESRGLGPAMQKVATMRGYHLRLPPWDTDPFTIETKRGFLSIHPSAELRLFHMRVHIPGFSESTAGFSWDIGSSTDLDEVVAVVTAWCEDMPLEEMQAKFACVELEEFSRAIDTGEPTALQWSGLLSSEFHQRQRGLLRRLHADEALRKAFPSVTHGAVRLTLDPLDSGSPQILVQELDGKRYEIMRVGAPGSDWVDVQSGDLIAYLRSHLNRQ